MSFPAHQAPHISFACAHSLNRYMRGDTQSRHDPLPVRPSSFSSRSNRFDRAPNSFGGRDRSRDGRPPRTGAQCIEDETIINSTRDLTMILDSNDLHGSKDQGRHLRSNHRPWATTMLVLRLTMHLPHSISRNSLHRISSSSPRMVDTNLVCHHHLNSTSHHPQDMVRCNRIAGTRRRSK